MFINVAITLHALISLVSTATPIVVDSGTGSGNHLVVSYLNGSGQRHDGADAGHGSFTGISTNPRSQQVFEIAMHNNTCASLLLMAKPKTAEKSCEKALRLATRYRKESVARQASNESAEMLATIHATLGVAHAALGKDALAINNLQEAFRIDADYIAARSNLVLVEKGPLSYAQVKPGE